MWENKCGVYKTLKSIWNHVFQKVPPKTSRYQYVTVKYMSSWNYIALKMT